MSKRRAYTLMELMVAMALGGFIALVTTLSFRNAVKVFTSNSGGDAAMRDLVKVRRALEQELPLASVGPNKLHIEKTPASFGGGTGADGDAVNFLSAIDSTTGEMKLINDGSGNPWYFQNIRYFVRVPQDHDTLFGQSCTGGNEGGYEYNCPHKVMLRGVADQNAATSPQDNTTEDILVSPLSGLLGRPTGFPKTAALRTVGANLLTFQVQRNGAELLVDLRAVSLADAKREVAVGNYSFRTGKYTIEHRFSIYPRN